MTRDELKAGMFLSHRNFMDVYFMIHAVGISKLYIQWYHRGGYIISNDIVDIPKNLDEFFEVTYKNERKIK